MNEFGGNIPTDDLINTEAMDVPTAEEAENQEKPKALKAHLSWKEKFVESLADYHGTRRELVHFIAISATLLGGVLAPQHDPAIHQFMDQAFGFQNNPHATPEQFLITGGAMIGGAAVLEIANYVTTKIAENKSLHNFSNRAEEGAK